MSNESACEPSVLAPHEAAHEATLTPALCPAHCGANSTRLGIADLVSFWTADEPAIIVPYKDSLGAAQRQAD